MKMDAAWAVPLPAIEIAGYFATWVGGVLFAAYHVYLVSFSLGEQLGVEELEPGWIFLGRKKDVADYEWRMWLPFLKELLPWFCLHHIVAELLRWKASKVYLRIWYVLVTSMFIQYYCGWIVLAVLLVAPLLVFSISKKSGPLTCWASSILCIIGATTLPNEVLEEPQLMAIYVCIAWIQLRCVSYCIDWINESSDKSSTDTDSRFQELQMLSYVFYLPLMFLGPFVSHSEFEDGIMLDINTWQSLKCRISKLTLNGARFLGWMALTEFCLHFIYCNAIQHHHEALPYLDAWTLNGLAYCIGQFFLNKYVVIYGLLGTLADFDGICPPPVPRCIAHISMYSDMWRHFDRGFYNFLRRYIYDPLVANRPRKHQVFCAAVTFAFVYVWHGLSTNIFVWSVCNFFGVMCETFAYQITTIAAYQQFERKLSPENIRRWRALVTSPLFIMSALTTFFFLGGMEVGKVFVSQVAHGSLIRNMALLLFAYCMCQVSMEIKMLKRNKNVTVKQAVRVN